jgi:hypothetical protein
LRKLENSKKDILGMISYNYFNNKGTIAVLRKKLETINVQMKNIKNRIGNSNMYIPNVGNLRRAGFSPKKQLPRTPNKKNINAPLAKQNNSFYGKNVNPNEAEERLRRLNKAKERLKRLRQTTTNNKAYKTNKTSNARAINAWRYKTNTAYGAIRSQISNKLKNSRHKMRSHRNKGQIFSHNPILVLNNKNKMSPSTPPPTPRPRRLEPINNLKSENLMKINLKNIKKLPLQTKRNIQTTAGKIIQEYYNDDGRSEMTNIQRKANQILTLLWDDL